MTDALSIIDKGGKKMESRLGLVTFSAKDGRFSLGEQMSARYGITAVQKFDSNGVIGVWLFLLGPIVSGLCIAWAVNDGPLFGNLPMAPYIIMALSGLAFLVGCVCMLIGRYQEITVRSLEP